MAPHQTSLKISFVGSALSIEAFRLDEERHSIDLELARKAPSKQPEPLVLRPIGERLSFLWAGVGETGEILEVVHHLVDEYGQLGRRSALPPDREHDCPRLVFVNGNGGVSLIRAKRIVSCRHLAPPFRIECPEANEGDFHGSREPYRGEIVIRRKAVVHR